MRFFNFINIFFFLLFSNICLLYSQSLVQQEQKYIEPFKLYNPSFNTAREQNNEYQEWAITDIKVGVHKKNIYYKDIKDSISCVVSGFKGLPIAMGFHAQYNFPLPQGIKKMKLDLIYGFSSYDDSKFYYNIIFNNKTTKVQTTEVLLKPTFNFKDEKWMLDLTEIELSVPKDANNFIIQLKQKGIASIGLIALGSLDISLDNKKISSYDFNQNTILSSSEKRKIRHHISKKLLINKSVRIIGVGESVHGSKELEKQGIVIVKERIVEGSIKMVILEATPILAYSLNKYIHGDELALKDFMEMKQNGYNTIEFIELLDFIKSYNQKNNKKVNITGFDVIMNENSFVALFEKVVIFFPESLELKKCLNLLKKQKNRKRSITINKKDINEISRLLILGVSKIKDSNQVLQKYIYHYLIELVNNSQSIANNRNYLRNRDSLMANNVSFLMDNLSKGSKALLLGHLGHIAKNNQPRESVSQFTRSMGYYLSKKYKKQYAAIGLYTGNGNFWGKRYNGYSLKPKKGSYPVLPPIGKSIEELCLLMNRPSSFYINKINKISLLDNILYERSQGVYFEPMQFESVDLRKELDVIWFTQNSNIKKYPLEGEFKAQNN